MRQLLNFKSNHDLTRSRRCLLVNLSIYLYVHVLSTSHAVSYKVIFITDDDAGSHRDRELDS